MGAMRLSSFSCARCGSSNLLGDMMSLYFPNYRRADIISWSARQFFGLFLVERKPKRKSGSRLERRLENLYNGALVDVTHFPCAASIKAASNACVIHISKNTVIPNYRKQRGATRPIYTAHFSSQTKTLVLHTCILTNYTLQHPMFSRIDPPYN